MLSERLFGETEYLWKESADKAFLIDMAKGTLKSEAFKKYMLQDYLYLKDYIRLLEMMYDSAEDQELKEFLDNAVKATVFETYNVHLPNLKSLDVTDNDIEQCEKGNVIAEYLGYMTDQLRDHGVVSGLTALLQCSWNYAYIAKLMTERYTDVLVRSKYKDWFEAYTSREYVEANDRWINALDERTNDISDTEADRLCHIFKTCAAYENKLWDYMHE